MSSHYLNQILNIVNWTPRNNLQWFFKRNWCISFKKIHLNVSSSKWQPCCLGLNMLRLHVMHLLFFRVPSLVMRQWTGCPSAGEVPLKYVDGIVPLSLCVWTMILPWYRWNLLTPANHIAQIISYNRPGIHVHNLRETVPHPGKVAFIRSVKLLTILVAIWFHVLNKT